jgi:hypothetical protein
MCAAVAPDELGEKMELGIVVAGERAPEAIPRLAEMAENAGLDHVWISRASIAGWRGNADATPRPTRMRRV